MLGGLCIEAVKSETANESRTGASGGPDGRQRAGGSVLEGLQGRIGLERLCHVRRSLRFEGIVPQAANRGRKKASARADSWGKRNMSGGILERFQRRCGRQETAQYDRPRHPNALAIQIQLFDAVLA